VTASDRRLLAIIELGGYPDFQPLYRDAGYAPHTVTSVRKALAEIKQHVPDAVVAEFNFQSDFRDRTSSLESLLAVVSRHPATRVIVFYDREFAHQLEKLKARFPIHAALSYPISTDLLAAALRAESPA
jgi:ActR/RegA family two-component response regulator